jgi:SAM-dependent methyltransferase
LADIDPMPLTQDDIRAHYEQEWKTKSDSARETAHLRYSNPVEDAVLYPIYEQLIRDLGIAVESGRILDVGSGAGRWVRFFLERFSPRELVGLDYTQASVDLLDRWVKGESFQKPARSTVRFARADITAADLDCTTLAGDTGFDLINIANVLFHIPEPDKFTRAMHNLSALVGIDGRIVTTEYLPRTSVRTNWMLVRSRYEFETAVRAAGLRIVDIRATTFFANDPMGLDGPDHSVRGHFHKVRAGMQTIAAGASNDASRTFFTQFFADLERCLLAYCGERIAQVDLPSQKLVVLARA